MLVDRPEDVRAGGDSGLDGVAGGEPDVLERLEAQRIRHRDVEVARIDRDRHDQMLPGDLLGDQFDRLGLDGRVGEVDQRDPELEGEGLGDLFFGGQPQGDNDVSQFLTPGALLGQGARQVLLGQKSGFHKQFAKTFPNGCQSSSFTGVSGPLYQYISEDPMTDLRVKPPLPGGIKMSSKGANDDASPRISIPPLQWGDGIRAVPGHAGPLFRLEMPQLRRNRRPGGGTEPGDGKEAQEEGGGVRSSSFQDFWSLFQ